MKYQPKHAKPKVRVNGKKYAPFVHAVALLLSIITVRYTLLSTIAVWHISQSLLGSILVLFGAVAVMYVPCAIVSAIGFMTATTWAANRRDRFVNRTSKWSR